MVLIGASIQSVLGEELALRPADPRQRILDVAEEFVTRYRLDAVELFLDGVHLFPDIVDVALFDALARLQQRLGVTFTAHLPYVWIDLSSANELVRQASVESVVRAVEMTGPLQIASYVLHATGPFGNEVSPGVVHPEQSLWVRLMLRSIQRSLAELRERLPDVPLAVETMEGFPFEWQAPIVEQLDLGVCCDVAHLAVRGQDARAFIAAWLPRIRQIHIHGVRERRLGLNVLVRNDHYALGGPGEVVDVAGLLALLQERGFAGPVILENVSRADLEASIETLRRARASGERQGSEEA